MNRPLLLLSVFAALTLAGCETSTSSNSCAFVAVGHLARPLDTAGRTIICNPKRVSAPYRDRYFPGYVWGDETW